MVEEEDRGEEEGVVLIPVSGDGQTDVKKYQSNHGGADDGVDEEGGHDGDIHRSNAFLGT